MILIERPSTPSFFHSEAISSENARMIDFYEYKKRMSSQSNFKPRRSLNSPILDLLMKVFNHKCAFCETLLTEEKLAQIDRFRPSYDAMNSNGEISYEHYWWLRYEWSNLYLICPTCNSNKRNLFPVIGKRVKIGSTGMELLSEKNLILDPCIDNPHDHFLFDESGMIFSDTIQGRTTIDILGLNRPRLIEKRKKETEHINKQWQRFLLAVKSSDTEEKEFLENYFYNLFRNSQEPYLLLKRQFILGALTRDSRLIKDFELNWDTILRSKSIKIANDKLNSLKDYKDYQMKKSIYHLDSHQHLESYYNKRQHIRRVEIRNFKTIGHIEFDLPIPEDGSSPWMLLLGENGCGKTSILKAVALALMGNKYRNSIIGLDARKYLKYGCKSGNVKVYITDREEPIEIRFYLNDPLFKGNIEGPPLLLMGYSSTRLSTLEADINNNSTLTSKTVRCDNLFNPLSTLLNAEKWLTELNTSKFNNATKAIKRLYAIDENYRFYRLNIENKKIVKTTLFGSKVSLDELSDGYQSITALSCDIMKCLNEIWNSIEFAQGVVLIDEIDAHLHPRWKMQIVSRLKEVFPGIQFIVTSHEPLCLRGLNKGQAVVLARSKNHKLYLNDGLPDPAALRIDQILTSEYFGLYSTIDQELQEEFNQYYLLLGINDPTEDELIRLKELESKLKLIKVLGESPREQIIFEAIDNFIAQKKEIINKGEVSNLRKDTIEKIINVWTSTDSGSDFSDQG